MTLAGIRHLTIAGLLALSAVALAAPSPSSQVPDLEVDRIEFQGVTVLSEQTILPAIEVSVGERPDRKKVVKSAENLQALYKANGYEQVRIRTQLARHREERGVAQTVLEFIVSEGLPTRVDKIRVRGDGVRSEAAQEYWKSIQTALQTRVALASGDILVQDKLGVSRRQLLDFMATREYIGARVDDVIVEESVRKDATAARWVDLEFIVTPGDRVSFGFRGNETINTNLLMSLIDEQRLLGLGRDYLNAIKARVEEEYRALGFAKVLVTPYKSETLQGNDSHVSFVVSEGPRVTLGNIAFDGNEAFKQEQLLDKFFQVSPPILQQNYYVEKEVQKSAELVIEWMKSRGYLSAKLVTINTKLVPSRRAGDRSLRADLTIYVYEWDQTVVQSVQVSFTRGTTKDLSPTDLPELSNTSFIKKIVGVSEGEPLNLFAFSEGMEALKAYYRAYGFLEVKLVNEGSDQVVKYSGENRFADISIEINPGPRYRVSQVVIEGLISTREEVLRRELQFKEGEILEEWRVTESEARLRRLGIFSLVTVRLSDDQAKPGFKVVRVSVQEGSPGVIGGGFGFRNDLGVRTFGGVSYGNLWGKNHTASLDLAINRRLEAFQLLNGADRKVGYAEYETRLSYTWPWFALGEMTFRPSLNLTGRGYRTFDASTAALSAAFERRLLAKPNLTGSFTISLERVRQYNSVDEENDQEAVRSIVDNQTLTLGSITPAFKLDLRDNPLAPTSGFLFTGSSEIAFPWLLSSGRSQTLSESFPIGYTRSQIRADAYASLGADIIGYFSFRMGYARSTADPLNPSVNDPSGAIPLIKQFALGGVGSLRGFQEQELNFQNFIIRGTQTYVNYRAQIDLPFAGALRFGPFLDAANLNVDVFSFGNLRWGTGFGFRYLTPVGPVNLDFGFKLFKPAEERDFWNVYFSIGVI